MLCGKTGNLGKNSVETNWEAKISKRLSLFPLVRLQNKTRNFRKKNLFDKNGGQGQYTADI